MIELLVSEQQIKRAVSSCLLRDLHSCSLIGAPTPNIFCLHHSNLFSRVAFLRQLNVRNLRVSAFTQTQKNRKISLEPLLNLVDQIIEIVIQRYKRLRCMLNACLKCTNTSMRTVKYVCMNVRSFTQGQVEIGILCVRVY